MICLFVLSGVIVPKSTNKNYKRIWSWWDGSSPKLSKIHTVLHMGQAVKKPKVGRSVHLTTLFKLYRGKLENAYTKGEVNSQSFCPEAYGSTRGSIKSCGE